MLWAFATLAVALGLGAFFGPASAATFLLLSGFITAFEFVMFGDRKQR